MAHALMAEYSASLHPEIAQITRELQICRSALGSIDNTKLAARLNYVEQRCIRLWSALGAPTVSPPKIH
jgi:hypothetical protein